jgi:putative membrane protein
VEWLPAFNTGLILVSGVFLVAGYVCVRRRHLLAHHRCMLTASVFAALFLVVYVYRWATFGSKPFPGHGAAYALYLGILVPHVVAAIAVGPLALMSIFRALKGQFPRHKRIARITFPIWIFAAASGWVVYAMLYLIDWP